MKLIVFCTFLVGTFGQMFKKVKLKDVDVLTLYQGKMTNGRRSSPIPQLQCRGGSAGCGAFVPEVVQCYNRGSDGLDVQWECKTDMDNEYRFGKISVSCEGYDYPDDPYILAGSCGLEYTIDLTKEGKQKSGSTYSQTTGTNYQESDGDVNWGVIIFICFVIFVCWKNTAGDDNQIPPAGTAPPPYNPDFIPPAGTTGPGTSYPNAPPPYSSGQTRQSRGWRPGFFSGFGAGWFGNNFFNNRGRGYTRHRDYSNQSAYNQGFSDGANTSTSHRTTSSKRSSSSSSSSGTRTASGFGGTSRR